MKLYKRKLHDPAPLGQADPYMMKASNGKYYIYATGPSGPQLYSSDSLMEGWEYRGCCLDRTEKLLGSLCGGARREILYVLFKHGRG